MQFIIRRLEPSDFEGMHELNQCPSVVHNTLNLPLQSIDQWRRQLAEAKLGTYQFVALSEGKLVGWISITVNGRERRAHMGRIVLAVHEDFQRNGIGKALMMLALDLADNWLGLRRIELGVYTDNFKAIKLYEKFGFVIEGTHRETSFRAGKYVDEHTMGRISNSTV